MKRITKITALLCAFLLLSSVGFGQIQAHWVKGKFTNVLKFEVQFLVKELSSAPSETSGYGTLYVLSSDSQLYFKTAGGVATNLVSTGVAGPGSSTDNAIVRFNGTGGATLQNSGVIIDDSNNVSGIGTLGVGGVPTFTQNSDTLTITGDGSDWTIQVSDGALIVDTSEAAADTTFAMEDASGDAFIFEASGLSTDVTWTMNAYTPVRTVILKIMAESTVVTAGDGAMYFTIPIELNGMNLVSVGAHVYTADDGADAITVDIYNFTDSQDMLSTALTIDGSEKDSATAAAAAAINASYDDVATADELRIDVTSYAGDNAAGLEIRLGFKLPT